MKKSWGDRDVLILIGGMRNSFQIDGVIAGRVTF